MFYQPHFNTLSCFPDLNFTSIIFQGNLKYISAHIKDGIPEEAFPDVLATLAIR